MNGIWDIILTAENRSIGSDVRVDTDARKEMWTLERMRDGRKGTPPPLCAIRPGEGDCYILEDGASNLVKIYELTFPPSLQWLLSVSRAASGCTRRHRWLSTLITLWNRPPSKTKSFLLLFHGGKWYLSRFCASYCLLKDVEGLFIAALNWQGHYLARCKL